MYEVAINLINELYNNGYEAFIIGGYVRDKLLGINSDDIDITTNAKPNDLLNIFENIKINEKYGSSIIIYNGFKFEITTYRKDSFYENNRWPKIKFIDSFKEDLLRRDFTINSIAIDRNGLYVDLFNGISDINNKIIRCIGNPNDKLKEDSLRILRAIRFMVVLDFKIDNELLIAIKDNIKLLCSLSYNRKKQELDYIFSSPNLNKYINMINELKVFEILNIKLENDIIWCDNKLGTWAQLKFSNKYNFTKNELQIIKEIRNIIKYGKIDNYTVYKYKKESVFISSKILNIKIDNIINNIPIKSRKEIDITFEDLSKIVDIRKINDIYIDLEKEILYNRLKNKKNCIIEYLISKRGD